MSGRRPQSNGFAPFRNMSDIHLLSPDDLVPSAHLGAEMGAGDKIVAVQGRRPGRRLSVCPKTGDGHP